MRALRLITLVLHLQVHGHASGRELADRLEVDERTVQRDVATLVGAGIPIRSTRGPGGGYRLDGGYRTRLTGVAAEEAAALAFLGLPLPAEQLGLGDALEAARTKVWASLSSEARERAAARAARFHLDPVRWYGTAEPVPHLAALAEAAWDDRRARMVYARAGRTPSARVVDPLGLVLAAGDWYLVALRDGERRTYRVSRVTDVELLDEPVRRPPGFDLADAWRESRRALETEHRLTEVTVRVAARALPGLRRVVAVVGQERVPVTAVDEVTLTVPFETETWACMALLGLGGDVEVLSPTSLRERVAVQARAVAARYPAPTAPSVAPG